MRPCMSELTNATMMDLTQDVDKDSTNDKYTKTDNGDERIALITLYRLSGSSLFPPFSSLYKDTQQN